MTARAMVLTTRWCQGVAGVLVLGVAWQSWALAQLMKPIAAVPPTLEAAWLTPLSTTLAARFDRVASLAPVASAPPPLAAGPAAPKLRLQGIVFGEAPRAYVVDEATNQTMTVRVGDQLGPVAIREIHERSVTIEQEDQRYELRL